MLRPTTSPQQVSLGQSRRAWLAWPVVIALVVCGLLLGLARVARADVAPFPAQAGTSLGTAGLTDIRMVSETVVMQVMTIAYTINGGDPMSGLGARVTADFQLDNPETKPQSIQVGFPLNIPPATANSGGFINLTGLRAFVAGDEVSTTIETVGSDSWSAWQMSFAPGSNHVRVTYDLPATVDACSAELGYVLHTGAAWAGAIGQADLVVRYPYAAEATFLSPHGIYLGNTTTGYHVAGDDLRWHYTNLEPTAADDLAVTFVTPECWLQVAAARAALNQHASAANYWNLASTYASIVFPHHGFYSPLIAQVADAQFLKALALDPHNPQINSDYAQFLVYQVGGLLPASRATSEIQQCAQAVPLAPQDDMLQSLCGPVLANAVNDTSVPPDLQSTVAAVLATPTEFIEDTPTAPPTAMSSATMPATASSPPSATASTVPLATTRSGPPATATLAATAIAALPASPGPTALPTPIAPASSALPWVLAGIVVVIVLFLGGGFIVWRRRQR